MALLDRLRPQPGWKHPDPATRASAIEGLPDSEQSLFASLARDDESPRVRRAAVTRLLDIDTLGGVARADADAQVRAEATARLLAVATESDDAERRRRAADAISDERQVTQVVRSAQHEDVALATLERVREPRALGSIARHALHEAVRLRATARLDDAAEIEAVALNSEHKDSGLAAVERLADLRVLEAVAERARNKTVGKRARTIVREHEMRDAEARAASETRARRHAQIGEALDLLARSKDVARGRAELARLTGEWEAAGPPSPESAARFDTARARATERFDAIECEDAAAQAARSEREAAVAARRQLVSAVAALDGADTAARVAELTDAWLAFPPLDGPEGPSLEREFKAASARARDREAARERTAARRTEIETLAAEAAQVVDEADLSAARTRWADVSRRWRELTEGLALDQDLYNRFHTAESRWLVREEAIRAQAARETSENHARVRSLCDRATALTGMPEASLKDLDHAVRDLRAVADHVGPMPSPELQETLSARVKTLLSQLLPRLRELRETDDWRRWANAGIQEELCKRVEALRQLADPIEAAPQLRDLRRQWKAVSTGPRDESNALWERFKTAADEVQARCDTLFSKAAAEQAQHLTVKQAICGQAEALAQSTDWISTADTLKRLQAEWNAAGPVPKEHAAELARRFRAACDTFFTRRKTDLAERKHVWAGNSQRKEALCVRVEALATSVEWATAFAEIKQLQAEWKTVGPVRKNRSEVLWKRFRAGCDAFFERYGRRHELEQTQRLQDREAVCQTLEALAASFPTAAPEGRAEAAAENSAREDSVAEDSVAENSVAENSVAEAGAPPRGLTADAEESPAPEATSAPEQPSAHEASAAASPAADDSRTSEPAASAEAALATAPAPAPALAATLEGIWKRWHEAPGLPPEAMQPLRARFDVALGAVLTARRESLRGTRFDVVASVARRVALCDEVEGVLGTGRPAELASSGASLAALLKESLAANTIGGRVNEEAKVRAAADRVRRAQSVWREVGPVPGEEGRALDARFQRACRRFFDLNPELRQQAPAPSHHPPRRDRDRPSRPPRFEGRKV